MNKLKRPRYQEIPPNNDEEDVVQCRREPFKRTKCYGRKRTKSVQFVYVMACLIWVVLIFVLSLWKTDLIGTIILLIPLLVYGFGFYNANTLTVEVEETIFSINYLSIALLVVIPLTAWINKNFNGDQRYLTRIMVVAVIIALLSLVDIWVRPKWISVVRHVKSALQTAALTLVVYALYVYYMGQKV